MATIKERGKAINIVYPYVTREGETNAKCGKHITQHWRRGKEK